MNENSNWGQKKLKINSNTAQWFVIIKKEDPHYTIMIAWIHLFHLPVVDNATVGKFNENCRIAIGQISFKIQPL
jgi:hypothetical protein